MVSMANWIGTLFGLRQIYSFSLGSATAAIAFSMSDMGLGLGSLPMAGNILSVIGGVRPLCLLTRFVI